MGRREDTSAPGESSQVIFQRIPGGMDTIISPLSDPALLIVLLRDYPVDPLRAAHQFVDCVEYIGASLVLSVATAVVTDLILREGK